MYILKYFVPEAGHRSEFVCYLRNDLSKHSAQLFLRIFIFEFLRFSGPFSGPFSATNER